MIERLTGIKMVAKRAEVSISTVSNVLNGTRYVSEDLRQRVLEAVRELQYEPNSVAQNLKKGNTNTIAVLIPRVDNIFFSAILQSIYLEAEKNGYTIAIYCTQRSVEQEKRYIQMLAAQRVSGILLSSSLDIKSPQDREYAHALTNLSYNGIAVPVVCMTTTIDPDLDTVAFEDTHCMYQTTQHLIDLGRRRIAYISSRLDLDTLGDARIAGYYKAIQAAGMNIEPRLIVEGDYSAISGYHGMNTLLKTVKDLDAVVCANDQMATGAIRAILDADLRIPEDIAVTGFNDNFPSTLTQPALTTIRFPKAEIGENAVELLLRRIKNPEAEPKTVRLSGQLLVRRSTDPEAVTDWSLDWF